MKTVFMFSGQGAQYAGMGKDLYKNYPVAKEIFDRADNVLGYSIKDICFEDEQKLGETEFAQPAILTMSIAAMKVLEEEGVRADMTAGLSLGEYSAYVASEAMDFEEAVALVQKRGKFMAEAVPSGEGAMYAIIGLDTALVEEACAEATAEGDGLAVPANYNAPGQIVIAGHAQADEESCSIGERERRKTYSASESQWSVPYGITSAGSRKAWSGIGQDAHFTDENDGLYKRRCFESGF